MNKIIAAVSLDRAALAVLAVTSTLTIGEAYTRTSLDDAQTAMESRYPPLSSIITEGELIYKVFNHDSQPLTPCLLLYHLSNSHAEHVRELEKNNLVVIHNVLSVSTLKHARENVEKLSDAMEIANHLNDSDVRQDQILSIRESDHEHGIHGDALIHCIKLLRGVPFVLNKFDYITSHSYLVPKQCQLARYKPDGSIYVRHLDRCNLSINEMGLVEFLRSSDYRERVVTAILYLNKSDWDSGGELRVFNHCEEGEERDEIGRDINPNGGKLILFDSSKVEHQVLESRDDDRYALTCWINGILT